jgi:hypothetical protein
MDELQKTFEEWIEQFSSDLPSDGYFDEDGRWLYADPVVALAWCAWQAASNRALAVEALTETNTQAIEQFTSELQALAKSLSDRDDQRWSLVMSAVTVIHSLYVAQSHHKAKIHAEHFHHEE